MNKICHSSPKKFIFGLKIKYQVIIYLTGEKGVANNLEEQKTPIQMWGKLKVLSDLCVDFGTTFGQSRIKTLKCCCIFKSLMTGCRYLTTYCYYLIT